MNNKIDKYLDSIYENRAIYFKYFAVVILSSLLRVVIGFLLNAIGFAGGSDSMLAWVLWAAIAFAPLKLWVFKNHCPDIYRLFTQIIVYGFCMGILWVLRSVIIAVLVLITANTALSMAIGGVICELICLALMINVAFRKKKS